MAQDGAWETKPTLTGVSWLHVVLTIRRKDGSTETHRYATVRL